MLKNKRNIILTFSLLFLMLGVQQVNAEHSYKTSVVKKILPVVVEVHSEKNIDSNPKGKKKGGFKFRNERNRQNQSPMGPRQQRQHIGSGFVISETGLVITNAHVVNNIVDDTGKATLIFHDDSSYEAKLVNIDEESDIALLKITNAEFGKKFQYIQWGEKPELGSDTIAIGSPMNQSFSVTFGNVSSLDRIVPSAASFVPFIQTDAAINPGNSGGPLFDEHGHVIGINTMIITDGGGKGSVGIGFAIDGDYAQTVIEKLKTGKKIKRPFLGIMYRPIKKEDIPKDDFRHGYGAYIQEVVPESPSDGIFKPGDIIMKMNGEDIKWKMLAAQIKMKNLGSDVHFNIIRDGLHIELNITLRGK